MDDASVRSMHVVMLPWLAFGHILPFTELAMRIARHGHRVTLLSAPRNTRRLIGDIPPDLAVAGLLRVVDVPLPRVAGLPDAAEATADLPSDDLRPLLRWAFDAAFAAALSDALREPPPRRPDWVLIDYAAHWAPAAAAAHGVPCAFVGLFSAAALGFIGPPEALAGGGKHAKTRPEHFTAVPEYVPFPTAVAFRRYEAREKVKPAGLAHRDGAGVSEAYRFGKSIEGSRLVGVRSSAAFEPEWLRLLGELYRKPVIPLGLLPPPWLLAQQGAAVAGHDATLRWLDGQAPGSVVYVAFGSEAKLTSAQLRAVALGLESSELPFLWAFRAAPAPAGVETAGEDIDMITGLPAGFEARVAGRGLVCRGWVPQIRLLSHGSVGGFLTHAGWNSVVEGLALGVRLVLLPLMFDQGLNARHLMEKKVGVEVTRDEDDGSFDGGDVAAALRRVMAEEEDRAEVKQLAKVFGNEEANEQCVRDFLRCLLESTPQRQA
ncbi:hypothetical protein ACP4OV_017412 [Aristida adscensionis]